MTEIELIRKYDLLEREPITSDYDYVDAPNFSNLSEYKKASISYISGCVAKMTAKITICIKCQNALVLSYHFEETSFLKFKDRGGLVKPTKSVVTICEETKRCFQRLLASTNGNLPNEIGIQNAISSAVLRSVDYSKIFNEQTSHMFDSAITDNHLFSLTKLISENYAKVCFYHLGKEQTAKITGKKLRKQLTKLILFKNQ